MRCPAVLLFAATLVAQTNTGELRVKVTDQSGLPIPCTVELISQVNQVRQKLETDAAGSLTVKRVPFGMYRVQVERSGFTAQSDLIEIRSAIPKDYRVTLGVAPIETEVVITESETLVDPHRTSTVNRIGPDTLGARSTALPGRSLVELVNTQPGWLLEANGVLHPRGSEYQTQYVIDGMPLTENRSPAFSPELEADDVQSMSILTAGYPAEYGRKLGGVIEVTTTRDARPGFHGKAVALGGSFASSGGNATAQYGWGRNTLSASGDVARTDRYLDPPVEQNYTNEGTNSTLSTHYERDLTGNDRIGVIFRRGQSRFEVPNEGMQQIAGQRQNRISGETAGQLSYQHVFSAQVVGDVRAMVRDVSAGLWSNALATPIIAAQDRGLREAYVKATVSAHFGRHEWKAGADADFGSLTERFSYRITDRSRFDRDTPRRFQFAGRAQDRERSAFVQDLVRLGNWTFSAGLRFDHYRLLTDESAVSPRLAGAWYWPAAGLVLRGSYDRVFQTPAFENLLLAGTAPLDTLNDGAVRLALRPSRGNFYEVGFAKGVFGKMRLEANYFRRAMNDFADDDLLLNTGVSFPIAFRKAEIHGLEAKLEIPKWGPVSGFVSYANQLGVGYLPVTGGLLLEDVAPVGRFPITQDQRNTGRARFRYEITPRLWAAMAGSYGSGLPVEFAGTRAQALAEYGSRIVNQVDFTRGRVRPSYSIDASAGAILSRKEKRSLKLQVDVQNLTDHLNVLDFAGLFSGTALAPGRSAAARLQLEF